VALGVLAELAEVQSDARFVTDLIGREVKDGEVFAVVPRS
jgi:hypothetical protein